VDGEAIEREAGFCCLAIGIERVVARVQGGEGVLRFFCFFWKQIERRVLRF
jgi:hypothetical protein